MAVAYSSAGAGVSTESSGAPLSPLCPATVNAGDILIAHVFWEGTTTAPSTPSGWTLLDGPRVIESTIARHWVFGKIADGTEDSAAVAFGSPAVTTQRGARVYLFTGRTGGTITELCTGFSATSHATDPQMPTVTTTLTGALAVALVGQNDNNTVAAATGATGGTWAEPVAEYTAALTPGLMMQLQTCTPTADPGTVSGGSSSTQNDPVGVIGFQIKPNNNQSVEPTTAALATTKYAPTVATPRAVTPTTANLVATTYVPTVAVAAPPVEIVPTTANLVTTAYAPAVATPRAVTPTTKDVVLTPYAPQVSTPVSVTPGTVDLVLTGRISEVATPRLCTPSTATLTITTYAPTVVAGGGSPNVIPPTLDLVLTGYAPTVAVSGGTVITPTTKDLVLTTYVPIAVTTIQRIDLSGDSSQVLAADGDSSVSLVASGDHSVGVTADGDSGVSLVAAGDHAVSILAEGEI